MGFCLKLSQRKTATWRKRGRVIRALDSRATRGGPDCSGPELSFVKQLTDLPFASSDFLKKLHLTYLYPLIFPAPLTFVF